MFGPAGDGLPVTGAAVPGEVAVDVALELGLAPPGASVPLSSDHSSVGVASFSSPSPPHDAEANNSAVAMTHTAANTGRLMCREAFCADRLRATGASLRELLISYSTRANTGHATFVHCCFMVLSALTGPA